ncbi:MAG: membrane protein insertase YidC [Elusimicrobiota bacterium]|jgi:YidC/Oxa1 family membrane protein insertase|nr:membrane protein insertase YidC [Elusimicrobiota bacterium]
MDKNFFIALAAAVLLYMGYTTLFPKPAPPMQSASATTQQSSTQTAAVKTATLVKTAASTPKKTEEKEAVFTLETAQANITFSSKGAAIKDFVFKDTIGDVNLTPYPGPGYFATLPDINFTRINASDADMAFEAQIAKGLKAVKKYSVNKEGGINRFSLSITNTTKEALEIPELGINFGPGLATVKSEESENPTNWRAICLVQEEGRKKPTINKITEKIARNPAKLEAECHNWAWAGIDNRYFLVAFVPKNWQGKAAELGVSQKFTYNKDSFFGLFGKKAVMGPELDIKLPSVIPAGQSVVFDADFYFGPKDYNELIELPYTLDRSIQFGFFGQFGKWARNLLEWIYGLTHNYGWAIVVMTFLIQILLFPLTYKQLKSSLIMQKIQPEMQRLQAKYKGDPATQQREVMALYKKYGANPLSGCLPIFIQLPIFLALFNALRTSWALHGAPFTLWIQDLSAKDPYYVLPIAMGIMMFVQQKLTMPDLGKDNPSMAMMKWMPLFMVVLFLNFPAGLTLYWFVSNCISFVINIFLKKKLAKAN